jgi:hypothetical protein
VERRGGIVFLDPSPPKIPNNGGYLGDESFRKQYCGHIINRD